LLYNLPNSCIALLFGLTGAVLFTGVLFLRVKLLRVHVNPDHARAAHDALVVVIGFAGLILAFSLVQEQINFRNLEAQVGTEANNLAQLDRLLIRYGSLGDDALRLSLREYANSIVNDEWAQLSKSRVSGRTTRLLRELSQDVSAVNPDLGARA
jgi:Protein of unknown function (DUF4239)